jgi:3D (Asp-Asp-Asp) domain-containing protein
MCLSPVFDFEVLPNKFGDLLPIIPSGYGLKDGKKVRYEQDFRITVTWQQTRKPAKGLTIWLRSDREDDDISPRAAVTDSEGTAKFTISSWDSGDVYVTVFGDYRPDGVRFGGIHFRQAWFEDTFLCTVYFTPLESEYPPDPKEQPRNLHKPHSSKWLRYPYVSLQGSGIYKDSAGKDQLVGYAANQGVYQYQSGGGKQQVSVNHSIAVDPHVIPYDGWVRVHDTHGSAIVGDRHADDVGDPDVIYGFHIDIYVGAGKRAKDAWKGPHEARLLWLNYFESCPTPHIVVPLE